MWCMFNDSTCSLSPVRIKLATTNGPVAKPKPRAASSASHGPTPDAGSSSWVITGRAATTWYGSPSSSRKTDRSTSCRSTTAEKALSKAEGSSSPVIRNAAGMA